MSVHEGRVGQITHEHVDGRGRRSPASAVPAAGARRWGPGCRPPSRGRSHGGQSCRRLPPGVLVATDRGRLANPDNRHRPEPECSRPVSLSLRQSSPHRVLHHKLVVLRKCSTRRASFYHLEHLGAAETPSQLRLFRHQAQQLRPPRSAYRRHRPRDLYTGIGPSPSRVVPIRWWHVGARTTDRRRGQRVIEARSTDS